MSKESLDESLQTASRRSFLGSMGALIASGFIACTITTPSEDHTLSQEKADWQLRWNQLLVEANKEGTVVVETIANQGSPRKSYDVFERAFPGVSVQHDSLASANLWLPKVLQEQNANIFTWDIAILAGSRLLPELKDNNAINPLPLAIFHPDALDDQKWLDGFEAGFIDREKMWGYALTLDVAGQTYINTDSVLENELQTINDLLNSKWKGKMIFSDPGAGQTNSPATSVRLKYGESYVKRLFVDQDLTYTKDPRQITEGIVRGKYSIALGLIPETLEEYQAQGVGRNIKPIHLQDLEYGVLGSILILLRNAPHPNASKLFINWLLTKAGQEAFVKSTGLNSRRLDVEPGNRDRSLNTSKKPHILVGKEEFIPQLLKTERLLKDLLNKK